MGTTERISISVDKETAAGIRSLVEQGAFESVSSAFGAAGAVLLEHEADKAAWWEETLRRCEEAEQHPERLIDPDVFFRQVREKIADLKKAGGQ